MPMMPVAITFFRSANFFGRLVNDSVDFNRSVIHIEVFDTLSAIIAKFGRIEIAKFTFTAIDTITVVQYTFIFHSK